MSITLWSVLLKSPRLNGLRWDHDSNDETIHQRYKIVASIDTLRAEYVDYMGRLSTSINSVSVID
jgi:hypothetical protein